MPEKKRSFWDLFTMVENGRLKSTFLLYSFALALVFLVVYAVAFALLTDPVHALLAPVHEGLSAVMECLVPALVTTLAALGCQRLAQDKRLAPAAYLWLAVAAIALTVIVMTALEPADWGMLLSLAGQIAFVPILMGGVWTLLIALRGRE